MSGRFVCRLASEVADSNANLRVRWVNTINTPISSVSDLRNGALTAGELTITALSSAAVKVESPLGAKHPDHVASVAVTADGATVNTNVVRGLGIVFDASLDVGWTAKVVSGDAVSSGGVVTDAFDPGIMDEGSMLAGFRLAFVNVGSADFGAAKVAILPKPIWGGSGFESFIAELKPHPNSTYWKTSPIGTRTLTFPNWTDDVVTGKKKADVNVDGNLCITGAQFDSVFNSSLQKWEGSRYQYGSSPNIGYDDGTDRLQGLTMMLRNTTADPSALSIPVTITDGHTMWQIAPEIFAGMAGTYGTADVDLTEDGQPTGIVTVGHAAYCWARPVVPDGAGIGNLRQVLFRGRGKST